jgi:hypothetical protein|tara:strand:- start:1278 stop:1523 length:246 start_codon:yes stop_codon:yes gene_type:complete
MDTPQHLQATPETDGMAFDVGHSAYSGNRHSKYGLLVYAEDARKIEMQLNAANERIQELEAYMALAKSGMQQLIEYWESKQ